LAGALLVSPLTAWAEAKFWTEREGNAAPQAGPDAKTFAPLVETTSQAVVNIDVRYGAKGSVMGAQSGGSGQGSGFLITADGYALTNNHVIENADEILVTLADDRRFAATVVGTDENTDIALIKLQAAKDLPVLPLGDSDRLHVGDWVLAIGSPLGLRSTVTAGIVSATGRRDVKPGNRRFYSNFIQTDASINPGNSGGPLINTLGEVIGINTAINREGQGIGFTIPVNMVKTILPTLKSKGFVERSWMGIMIQELDGSLARSFGLKAARGALITDVVPNGPGDQAGLESGDVVLEFDGTPLGSSEELPWLASVAGVNRNVPLVLWRDGQRREVQLHLEPLPGQQVRPAVEVQALRTAVPLDARLGIIARDLPPHQRLDGALVTQVDDTSPAHASGLRPGDVIVEVGAEPVKDSRTFYKLLEGARELVRVKVARGTSTHYFAFDR
jgi:serine protease Do